uniref:C2H2-type domain-containing protein n=1 Tax=Panagrolaimus davidi TaxID=227884 RepID=A0A914P3M9_9BILA
MMIGILILIIGLAILIIIGLLIFLILKYRNEKQKQKRRRRSNRGKYRFNDIRSKHLSVGNRYMNENSDAFMSKIRLFDDVLICGECRFRTNDIHKFADHKSHECLNIIKAPSEPKSIECCENTFKSSWKLLQHLTEKHNLNLYRDESTTDDSQEKCGPQPPSPLPSESVKSGQKSYEMLCNKNSPILYDSTDAHKMSKDYCIGEIVYEEKQTYTYDKKPISPTTTTSTTSGGFNALNIKNSNKIHKAINNTAGKDAVQTINQPTFNQHTTNFIDRSNGSNKKISANTIKIKNKRGNVKHVKQSNKQTNFNQHTTNFIVCYLDPSKPLNL